MQRINYGLRFSYKSDEMARPLTDWGPKGRMHCMPTIWPEYLKVIDIRRKDMLEIYLAAQALSEPDREPKQFSSSDYHIRDPLVHSFYWDISQNVAIAPMTSTPGVVPCLTPAGMQYSLRRGRPVLGYEKLILQGIPVGRLRLGPETECNMSDLAGNAMTLPVVGACMLAAICAPSHKLENRRGSKKKKNAKSEKCDDKVLHFFSGLQAANDRISDYCSDETAATAPALDMLRKLAEQASGALASSYLCNCETSGSTSAHTILKCTHCGLCVCKRCAQPNLGQTNVSMFHDLSKCNVADRDAAAFKRVIRKIVPTCLRIEPLKDALKSHLRGLGKHISPDQRHHLDFALWRVERRLGAWGIVYRAMRGRVPLAQIDVRVGRVAQGEDDLGVVVEVREFSAVLDGKRGAVRPCARLVVDDKRAEWLCPPADDAKPRAVNVTLRGQGDHTPSYRSEVGVNDYSDEVWPGEIVVDVSGADNHHVAGVYVRTRCRGVGAFGAIWRKSSSPARYIYVRPDVHRIRPDTVVIAASPHFADAHRVIASLGDFRNDFFPLIAEGSLDICAQFVWWQQGEALPLLAKASTIVVSRAPGAFCQFEGLSQVERFASIAYDRSAGGSLGAKFRRFLTTTVGAEFLRFLSDGNLDDAMENQMRISTSEKWGSVSAHDPPRPPDVWTSQGRRVYDFALSNAFETALRSRPPAWELVPGKDKIVVNLHPDYLAHRAASMLLRGRGIHEDEDIDASYVVSPRSTEVATAVEFAVPNSDGFAESSRRPPFFKNDQALYARQARCLSRLQAIDDGKVEFVEEERAEEVFAEFDILASASAKRSSTLRGGVLADTMGAGKTVTAIALIACGAESARAARLRASAPGHSSATLVVVPNKALLSQWRSEFTKFVGTTLRVVAIPSVTSLKTVTASAIRRADVVIVVADLLADKRYVENIAKRASAGIKISPLFPAHRS